MAVREAKAVECWPCKFCCSNPVLHKRKIKSIGREAYMVSCSNMRCQVYPATGWHSSAEDAAVDWNRKCGDKAMHAARNSSAWRK